MERRKPLQTAFFATIEQGGLGKGSSIERRETRNKKKKGRADSLLRSSQKMAQGGGEKVQRWSYWRYTGESSSKGTKYKA